MLATGREIVLALLIPTELILTGDEVGELDRFLRGQFLHRSFDSRETRVRSLNLFMGLIAHNVRGQATARLQKTNLIGEMARSPNASTKLGSGKTSTL